MKKTIIWNLNKATISAKRITEWARNPAKIRKTSLRSGRLTSSRNGS